MAYIRVLDLYAVNCIARIARRVCNRHLSFGIRFSKSSCAGRPVPKSATGSPLFRRSRSVLFVGRYVRFTR